jgi:hypothetical protein
MVVWEDARNTPTNISNMDVYGQFLDYQGQLSGSNFPITFNSSNQKEPAVAFGDDDSREFLIAWKDGRNATDPDAATGDADIYGNFWEYSTAPALQITWGDESGAGRTENDPIFTQAMDFGGVSVFQTSTSEFRIWNKGNAPLAISSITPGANVAMSIDPGKPFNVTTAVPTSINPGTFYDMTVNFTPSTVETFSGEASAITIASNGGTTKLYFSGHGIGEAMSITNTALPDGAANIAYSTTLGATGGITPYTWSVTAGALPTGLSLNGTTGIISGTPTAIGDYTFTVQVADASGNTAAKSFTISIASLAIATSSLSDGAIGTSYSATLEAVGGTAPFTWAITSGALPTGLSLGAGSGVISGTPAANGTFTFTVRVTDAASLTATKQLSIKITSGLTIVTASLSGGNVDSAYSATLSASGGTIPYTWEITAGALPGDLSLDENSGVISGTPSAAGTYDFIVTVTDLTTATATATLSITVSAVPAEDTTDGTTGGNQACYIATAAYGSYLDPHVMALRNFRDRYLITNAPGRALVAFYYRTSPPVADFIARHEAARTAVRLALTPVVYGVEYPLLGGLGMILLAGGAGALAGRRRGTRR